MRMDVYVCKIKVRARPCASVTDPIVALSDLFAAFMHLTQTIVPLFQFQKETFVRIVYMVVSGGSFENYEQLTEPGSRMFLAHRHGSN